MGHPLSDKTPWTPPDADGLKRRPRKAEWADVLLLEDSSLHNVPETVVCICTVYRDIENTYPDFKSRWTIEKSPRYVARRPKCNTCRSKAARWTPIDSSIISIDAAALSKLWTTFTRENWAVDVLRQDPDIFFPQRK